ncbi:VanZ family protein [Paenibacillus psychroresistens]|uniref:VanZ family protein n=2 Tax=Paenibacillus psychroresistens TaxID=1778678 RepID=A0A6B8S038_9BACL|nr:VanZ family protein [Paenibacillus psychroresistens]
MKQKNIFYDIKIQLMFAIYVYVLCKVVLFKFGSIDMTFLWQQLKISLVNPDYISRRIHHGNLTPFKEISRTMNELSSHDLFYLVGNIAIFMPYGILLGLLSKNKKISFIGAFIRSFGLSLCLESAQAVFSIGSFDVDDLILNSSGGLIGFFAFKIGILLMGTTLNVTRAKNRPV